MFSILLVLKTKEHIFSSMEVQVWLLLEAQWYSNQGNMATREHITLVVSILHLILQDLGSTIRTVLRTICSIITHSSAGQRWPGDCSSFPFLFWVMQSSNPEGLWLEEQPITAFSWWVHKRIADNYMLMHKYMNVGLLACLWERLNIPLCAVSTVRHIHLNNTGNKKLNLLVRQPYLSHHFCGDN